MSGRTTLKSYFLTGSSPTEAQFADLIDSVLVLSEDLTDSLTSDSTVTALSASGAKSLNDSLTSLTARVVTLEGADDSFASNYYTKSEIDSQIATVSGLFNDLPYTAQIAEINSEIDILQIQVSGFSQVGHGHVITDISGLQDELELKATKTYVDNVADLLAQSINAIVPGSDESDDVAQLQNYIDAINAVIDTLPTSAQFDTKSDVGHDHTVSDITDIGDSFYNKSETDVLLSSVVPQAHTHIESDITDLDKYTQAATDLKINDHSGRTDNPHGVTKAQVGLGNVENLSVSEIFQTSEALLLATKSELQALDSGSNAHTSDQNNPHNVTKSQVGLGNVPNVNFQSLLDAHLAADNPHEIDVNFFDVYTTGETDTRIQFYIDALRYNYTPTSSTDGAGAVGDYAWDANNFYVKTGASKWETIEFLRTNASGQTVFDSPILAEDGLVIGSTGDTANLTVNGNSTITGTLSVTSNTTLTGTLSAGSTTVSSLNAGSGSISTTGTLSTGGATVTSLNAGSGAISTTGTLSTGGATVTSLNAGTGTIQGGTITGTSLSTGTGAISGGAATVSSLDAGTGAISTTGTLSAGGATVTSLNAGSGAISTTGTISGGATTVSSLSTTGSASVGSLTSTGALSGTDLTLSGNLTVNGTTTTIDTTNLVIEDNIVVLNKNQTGTPPNTLKSGFEVERGNSTNVKFFWDESDDKWKADIGGTIKTVAFTDTEPASHTHTLSEITDSGTSAGLDVAATGNASTAQVVKGNDTRLTNSRTPTSHAHGNITNTGKIGSTANLPVITTTAGTVTTGSFGTSANTFCQGNDSRLSDARAPTAHNHDSRYARYDASQSLSAAQKSQILGNIGAAASADVGLTQAQVEALLYSK